MFANILCLEIWILVHLSQYECSNVPRISSSDGNLIIYTDIHKNVSFETNEQCSVLIHGEDLVKGFSIISKVEDAMKKYDYILRSSSSQINRYWFLLIQRNGIGQRIRRLENVTKIFSNSSLDKYKNIDLLRSEIISVRNEVVHLNRLLTKNECRSSPCKNGGTCQDLFNGVYCNCATGWEGFTCEKDVDECARFNSTDLGCQNSGICVNKPGTYECLCVNGWYGLHCTRKTTDCNSGPVSEICGHGTCVSQNTAVGYTCLCDQGWKKTEQSYACTQDIDECKEESPRCSKDPPVSCENTLGSFRCGSCPAGYTGNGYYCSDINECELFNGGCSMNPMVNCENIPGSKRCGPCPLGYVGNGVTCTYRGICNINNGNCHPLAVCHEYPSISSTYAECRCPVGYKGNGIGPMGCVPSTSPCDTHPCHHGRCVSNIYALEGYICRCHGLYYGKHCDQTDGLCGSNPCINGGTCIAHNTTSYECSCPLEYTGSDCSIVRQECGGNLGLMEEGSITFPVGFSTQLENNFACSWQIRTEEEKNFKITFQSFNVGKGERCDKSWLQVNEENTDDDKSRKFCGNRLPNNGSLFTTTNNIVINLKNDDGTASFRLKWISLEVKCHEKHNLSSISSGIIRSIGATPNYKYKRDCFWYLQGPISGKLIILTFHAFDIGNDTDCTGNYLQVFSSFTEGQDVLAKVCGGPIPAPLTSLGPEVLIHFHSDGKNSYPGFQIRYSLTQGERGCGRVFKTTEGTIYSPLSQYSGQMCFYQIQQGKQLKIKLTFIALSMDDSPGCTKEYVELFEGLNSSSSSIGRYCGKTTPATFISASNIVLIKFKKVGHDSKFRLKYEAACGGTFDAPSGIIQSEGYPDSYSADLKCVYLIRRPPGFIITLEFLDLDFEYEYDYDTDCTYDYLEVRDGNNENATLIGSYCGTTDEGPIMSSSNYLWLRFVSDFSDGGKGFKANYTSSVNKGCGGVLTNRTGSISVESDSKNLGRKACRWILQAPVGFVIQIYWITFNIINNYYCLQDFVNVYENNSYYKSAVLVGTYCGDKLPPVILTSSNVATISATIKASKKTHGFTAHYAFINETTVCGGNYFTSSGVIKSPRYPQSYPPNSDCVWTITVPSGQKVRLETKVFVGRSNCNYQYLEIRNGGSPYSPLIDRYCNNHMPKVIVSHTNQLYIHILSGHYILTSSKFMFSWTSTTTGCGGTLSSPFGAITSPHYPEPYRRMTECSWKIIVNLGSLIQFIFLDLDLETIRAGQTCSFDYVQIFDGISGRSKSLGRFCSNPVPTSLLTSNNRANVYFRSDLSVEGRGFNLKYRSVCSNNLTGYGGVIESPNYPEPNPFVQDCYWKISVSKNNKINITFLEFDLTQKNQFQRFIAYYRFYQNLKEHANYLEIKYAAQNENGDEHYVDFAKYNGTSIPELITIPSDQALLHFKSGTNMLGKGFRLEWIIHGCGGHLRKPGNITSPNYPNKYPNDIECDWLIEAPIGYSIIINFTSMDVEREDSCIYDGIKVFNGPDASHPMLGHICHIEKPIQYTGNGHMMNINFISDSSYAGKGFAAHFHFIRSKCGGTTTAPTGTITSPNYPRNFDRSDTCEWLIITDENHVIDFEFENMDLISSTNCTSSYVKIYDGSNIANQLLAKVCDGTAPNKTYTSTSNQMLIIFKSNGYITSLGFKGNYYKACGALIQAQETSGTLKLQRFSLPTSERNQNCTWTVTAPNADQHVSLTITQLQMDVYNEGGAGVSIYNGESSTSPIIASYQESKSPPTIVSDGASLHVVVDRNVNFFATYEIFGTNCGGLLNGLNGMFSTPGYPKSYPFSTACEWTIQLAPGNEVSLSFQIFDVPDSPKCNEDFLEIRKNSGTGRLLGIFCGNKKPNNITHQGSLWIYFKTCRTKNDSIPLTAAKGFFAEYTMNTAVKMTSYSGEIASPLYPESFSSPESFSWTISSRSSMSRIYLEFKDLYTESFDDNYCYSSYVNIYDGPDNESPKLGSFCGTKKPPPIESSSNNVYIEANMNTDRLQNKFYIKWHQIFYPKGASGESCGSSEIIDISEIHEFNFTSPGYPYGYKPRLRCEWNFQTSSMNSLKISFEDLSLDHSLSCYFDRVEIFSRKIPVKTVCNHRHTNVSYNTANMMRIVFSTNAYWNGTGFAAKVSEVCGGIMSGPSGMIIFNEHTPRDQKCKWTISVKSGRRVEIKFSEFSFPNNAECANYIWIRNGLSSWSPNLGTGKYCNKPPVLVTTSNNLYFEFKGNPNSTTFKASYKEISYDCGGYLTLNEENPFTLIHSPNYPNKSERFVECFWVIKSTPGTYIQLDFVNLFDFHKKTDCSTEAVELRDGGTVSSYLMGRFCDKAPGSQFSSDNMMFVRFFTEENNPGRGFSANVTTASCGGTYKGQSGEIKWHWDSKQQLIHRNCTWHIIVPPYASLNLKITFEGFLLSSYTCHRNGMFSINEVVKTTPHKTRKLADMCDRKTHKSLTTVSNHVVIEFTDIMKSYKYPSPSSFSVVYNATKTECMYTETSDFGTIQSPGYPQLNYLVAFCSWLITVKEGRRITLNITDFDLERYSSGTDETGQYLKFYDYGEYFIETLLYNSTKRIIKSSGNTLQVVFSCPGSTNHRGFSADFTSNEQTVCNQDFSGERGQISRNRDDLQYSCLYKNIRNTPINSTLVLTMKSSIVYKIKEEESSYIDVLARDNDRDQILFAMTKPTLRPVIVRTSLPETSIKIHMAGADANFTIDYEHYQCGGNIKGERGFFSTPGYPLKFNKHLECAWVINLPEEHQVKLDFASINLGDDCEKSYIMIYNGKYPSSPRIGKFCSSNKPDAIISQRNDLLIEYHYEESSTAIGFNATYEPVIKGCGGIFSDKYRIIETPNYPKDYPNNAECRWTIIVDEGFHLELQALGRFHLELTERCKNDYVEVFDWKNDEWVTLGKKCGRNFGKFQSSENKMLIVFRSNERVSGVGFQAEWKKKCGGRFQPSDDKKYVISPGYPYNYENNLICTYNIHSRESFVVEFEDFELEGEFPTCTNDRVKIRSVMAQGLRDPNVGYCGTAKPGKYQARFYSTIIFSTDTAVTDRGFKFSLKTNGCGETITAPRILTVNSTVPIMRASLLPSTSRVAFFRSYNPYFTSLRMSYLQNCLWNITAPKGKVILMKFTKFSAYFTDTCSYNSLQVYDGSKRDYRNLLATLCGTLNNELPVLTSTNNTVLLYLKQLGITATPSFSVDIGFAPGPSVGCGGTFNLTKLKVIKPPKNLTDVDCQWKFIAAENHRIQFNFNSLNMPTLCNEVRLHGSKNCTCSFIEIRDGSGPFSTLMDQLCSHVKNYTDQFQTSWKFGFLRFYSVGNSTDAFEVSVEPVFDICGPHEYIATRELQTLTSPRFPGIYPTNIRCMWLVTKKSLMDNLVLRFAEFDLTSRSENLTENVCTHDRVEIDESDKTEIYRGRGNRIVPQNQRHLTQYMFLGSNNEILQFCGKESKPFNILSKTYSVNVGFVSTSEVAKGKGFKLEFFLSGCDYNYTQDYGRILIHDNRIAQCSIYITSSENTTISLYFYRLWFISAVENCSRSFEVYDGHTKSSPLLLQFCGSGTPFPVFSNSNKMFITMNTSSFRRNLYAKIDATFVSTTKGKGCGGKILDRTGIITSPMYPKNDSSDSTCEWEIQGIFGVKMSLTVRVFDITAPCDVNYLKITTFSLAKANERTFCKKDNIGRLQSDSKVMITYKSSVRNTGKGWTLEFRTFGSNIS